MHADAPYVRPLAALGGRAMDLAEYVGGMALLGADAARWAARSLVGRGGAGGAGPLARQVVRLGLRSAGIVALVQLFVGMILAMQMAPPLEPFGYLGMVANIIGVAVFRELGPLISAVVLSGFAGASIAAELGTMVVGEEVEALEAHAIPPVRFLVVPRLAGTIIAMVCLCVVADLAGCLGGYLSALAVLGPGAHQGYWQRIAEQLTILDFATGVVKAGVFGLILGLLACHEGLRVRGGAEGVGRATTMTVVYTIVALVLVDCVFTVVFYVYRL